MESNKIQLQLLKEIELLKARIADMEKSEVKRKLVDNELAKHRVHLEELVKERTQELQDKNKELDNAIRVFVGRELTIRDLRRVISKLKEDK